MFKVCSMLLEASFHLFVTDPTHITLNRFKYLYALREVKIRCIPRYSRLGRMNATCSCFRISISEYL